MPPSRILVAWSVAVAVVAVARVVVGGGEGKSVTLTLERASHDGLEVSQLMKHDRVRHSRFLQQRQPLGIIDFPLQGISDPFLVGLYYTKIQLGNPPKEFNVQIDTGSDVLWVSCNPCNGCPKSTGLPIKLGFFDPSTSSTASGITCTDQRCAMGARYSDSVCSNQNQCQYTFKYADGSGTSGYYVSDSIYLNSNSSAPIVFGCSTSHTGDLTKSDRAVDGIFGFGQAGLSVISQLSSQGITPKAFSHCLKGDNEGGGVLVLGEVVDPNIVYTPLVPLQPHYNVNLQSIAINGKTLSIDPSVFATSNNGGTIVDSGTTLSYLVQEAYDPFVTAITQSVPKSVRSIISRGNKCYISSSSVSEIFPPVSLNFAGGASMILRPQDYLVKQNSIDGVAMWCIGIRKSQSGITILGDLVLKDKFVVYDLADQRIGWANFNCSSSVNVNISTTRKPGKTEFVNAGQIDDNNSAHYKPYMVIPITIITSLLHIAFFGILPFL